MISKILSVFFFLFLFFVMLFSFILIKHNNIDNNNLSNNKEDDYYIVLGEIPENLNVWLSADWHIGLSSSCGKTACADANDFMDIDITFVLGDYVNGPCGMVDNEWVSFYNLWDNLTGTGNIFYRNEILGNHEGLYERWYCNGSYYDYKTSLGWAGNSKLTPDCGDCSNIREYCYKNQGMNGENYIFQYGNILFIVLPSANYVCYNGESGVANTSIYVDWVNQTIQKNQDKNIIVLCHYDIDTGGLDYYDGLLEQEDYYWMMQNYNIFAWIHGHTHKPPSVKKLYGTYHISTGVIQKNKNTSIMLNFTDGSNKVNIVQRNHDSHSWSEIISDYDTLDLDYVFDSNYISSENDTPV